MDIKNYYYQIIEKVSISDHDDFDMKGWKKNCKYMIHRNKIKEVDNIEVVISTKNNKETKKMKIVFVDDSFCSIPLRHEVNNNNSYWNTNYAIFGVSAPIICGSYSDILEVAFFNAHDMYSSNNARKTLSNFFYKNRKTKIIDDTIKRLEKFKIN